MQHLTKNVCLKPKWQPFFFFFFSAIFVTVHWSEKLVVWVVGFVDSSLRGRESPSWLLAAVICNFFFFLNTLLHGEFRELTNVSFLGRKHYSFISSGPPSVEAISGEEGGRCLASGHNGAAAHADNNDGVDFHEPFPALLKCLALFLKKKKKGRITHGTLWDVQVRLI